MFSLFQPLEEQLLCGTDGMKLKITNITILRNLNVNHPMMLKFINHSAGKTSYECMTKVYRGFEEYYQNFGWPSIKSTYDDCGIESHTRNGTLVYSTTIIVSYKELPNPDAAVQQVYREHVYDLYVECTVGTHREVDLETSEYLNVTRAEGHVFSKGTYSSIKDNV